MAQIRITDLTLRTIIGINDWERKKKQDIVINILIDFDATRAAVSDNISDTVNYKALKQNIIQLVEASNFFLLEKLTAEVLKLIMEDPQVEKATVRIDKPQALRFAKSVSMEMSATRD